MIKYITTDDSLSCRNFGDFEMQARKYTKSHKQTVLLSIDTDFEIVSVLSVPDDSIYVAPCYDFIIHHLIPVS